jgi:hypothetical protein
MNEVGYYDFEAECVWYPEHIREFVQENAMEHWDKPQGKLKILMSNELWNSKMLKIMFLFREKLYVRHNGSIVKFSSMCSLDWFVAPRQLGFWEMVRGCDRKIDTPPIPEALRVRQYVTVDVRGPTVEHIVVDWAESGEGMSIVVSNVEYICQLGKVFSPKLVDPQLKILLHERYARLFSKDFLNASFYEDNRGYAAWSRQRHTQQALWLKE